MWRTQAIVERLRGDLGGLAEVDAAAVKKARRRGLLVVFFDWFALVVLLLWRDPRGPQAGLSAGETLLFTLGLLAVAVHSGYRLAQVHQLSRIERLVEDLEERRGE